MYSRHASFAALSVTIKQVIDIDDLLPHHSFGREAMSVGSGRSCIVLKLMSL